MSCAPHDDEHDETPMDDVQRPTGIRGGRADEQADARVTAVLEVLGGAAVPEVAARWSTDPALLHRWVRAFVDAGTAQVTNRPDEHAAASRDRFLAAFAHELRSPLSVAQGWVGMMLDGDLDPAHAKASVRRLHAALGRLADRTLDVELLAAASLGRLRVCPEALPLRTLAAALPDLPPPDEATGEAQVEVDPHLFPRVLRDLWEAASHSPAPRSVALEVVEVGPWVEVRVVRRGQPIDTTVLQALFEPFDLNDDATGVTIGLYLARALAVAHGGTIGVDQDETHAVLWVRVPRRSPLLDLSRSSHPTPSASADTDPGGTR